MPRSARISASPDFSIEESIGGPVCGLDEVGRGPLAGPVVAACVYIPGEKRALDFVPHIRDSKKLTAKKLAELDREIRAHFVFGIAEIAPAEIDRINILQASLKAMKEAFLSMSSRAKPRDLNNAPTDQPPPRPAVSRDDMFALIDGNKCPKDLPCPSTPVVKGDNRSVSIAAASIIAKVHRDAIMQKLAQDFPPYGWERNVGYPTQEHLTAIQTHGICLHHRKSFGPVKRMLSR